MMSFGRLNDAPFIDRLIAFSGGGRRYDRDVQAEKDGWLDGRRRMLASRRELLQMLRTASPWMIVAAVIAALIAGLLPVGLILAGGLLSERIYSVSQATDHPSFRPVYEAFTLVMGLFLLGEVMVPVQSRLRWLITKRVDGDARLTVMRGALLGTDMSRLHSQEFLDAMALARGLIRWSATPGQGAAGMIGLSRDYLTVLAAAAVVAWFQPLLALGALVVGLIVRLRWRAIMFGLNREWFKGVRHRHEAGYFTELGLGRRSANELRLFGIGEWFRQRIDAASMRAWAPTWAARRFQMGVL
jgi:ATP-binding cassette subfamily B protein